MPRVSKNVQVFVVEKIFAEHLLSGNDVAVHSVLVRFLTGRHRSFKNGFVLTKLSGQY